MAGAKRSARVLVFLWCLAVLAVMHGGEGTHHAAAPSPSIDCSSALLSLSDCLSFVEAGSSLAKPQKECCSGLRKVVKQEEGCLCDAFKQGASFGVKLNMTKALTLPSSCGISTPHLTKCKIILAAGPNAASDGVPNCRCAPSPSSTGAALVPSPFSGQTGAATSLLTAPVGGLVGVATALCFYYYIH